MNHSKIAVHSSLIRLEKQAKQECKAICMLTCTYT